MVLDKYIKIEDSLIHAGMNERTGMWYCKDLPAKTEKELDHKMGEVNRILNKYNKDSKKLDDK